MLEQTHQVHTNASSKERADHGDVVVGEAPLSIEDVFSVAVHGTRVRLWDDERFLDRIRRSHEFVMDAVENEEPIYGVTTGFGGMAHTVISRERATELQNNAIWLHKTGAGAMLPAEDVRAAMLLRMNSHAHGASGVRLELIHRLATFLNAGVTPHVPEYGSIGASGDLVPLTYVTGALIGLNDTFTVDYRGQETDALSALAQLDLEPMQLRPKEGLAMINGTSVMTGIAANCIRNAQTLLALSLGAHALFIQALRGTNQSFHPFIHRQKPHVGQKWSAEQMLQLLEGSALIRDELNGEHDHREDDLIQDRYSLRCLPQYTGPIVDGLVDIARRIEVEMNAVTDNPLIDIDQGVSYHGGNFLGQYIGVAMDQLRYYVGLMAKHLDVQIALLVAPEFNNGLSPSLIGNPKRLVNMGLKGLQLSGNSIMPLLGFLGNSLIDRFPTHAEQFNQNINSQGYGAANLAREAIDIMQQYTAIALMFGVQAVDLRTYEVAGHYDARACLSPATQALYEAVRSTVGKPPSTDAPYVRDDNEQVLDADIEQIARDIATTGNIPSAVNNVLAGLTALRRS